MSSTWRPHSVASSSSTSNPSSSLNNASSFDSLPYPYPPSSSVNTLAVPEHEYAHCGGGGSIRRVRSSGALEMDSNRRPSFQTSWFPDPFFSDDSAPNNGEETVGRSYTTFGTAYDPSWRFPSTPSFAAADHASSWSPRAPPLPQDNPRRFHRRTSSAQPAFFASSPVDSSTPIGTVASGLSDAPSRKTSISYSHTTPSSHRMQGQPSKEEVDTFLRDMGEMLGPDTMASLGSPTAALPARANGLTLTSTSSPPNESPGGPPRQTYNVSGVLLTEEEYRQYTHSEELSTPTRPRPQQFPSSASHQYASPSSSRKQVYAPQPSPGYDLNRPRSAPPSPQVDLPPGGEFAPFYSPPSPASSQQLYFQRSSYPFSSIPPTPEGYVRPFHRRGSSVDATIPRTFVSTPSVPISYGYASYPTQPTPPLVLSNEPVGYPPPPPHHYYLPTVTTPTSRVMVNQDAPVSPISPTTPRTARGRSGEYNYRADIGTSPTTPSRATPGTGRGRGRGGGGEGGKTKRPISFINFSASDSKVLLSGVAPSGTSKKRQRDANAADLVEVGESLGSRQGEEALTAAAKDETCSKKHKK